MNNTPKMLEETQELMQELNRKYNPAPDGKQVEYVNMEILFGRTIGNTLMNLPKDHALRQTMRNLGFTEETLEDLEREPSLGNGGLGRLAAGLLESAATKGFPFAVNTLRYRLGLLKQEIVDGRQVDREDPWLKADGTNPYERVMPEDGQQVWFRDESGCWVCVNMIPSLIPQLGRGGNVAYLRTWKVGSVRPEGPVSIHKYERIDAQLYCDDSDDAGKLTRIRQEYALSSAIVGLVLTNCRRRGIRVQDLPKYYCLHINDTHASFMIPELLHRLLEDYHFTMDQAWKIVTGTFVYTNHTILSEALEKWPVWMIQTVLPHIYDAIDRIHKRFQEDLRKNHPEIGDSTRHSMAIIRDGLIHMAYMDIYAAASVNGVAKLHTEILCKHELSNFYRVMPWKFCNITNAVTHRKFLIQANPELAQLITDCLGSEDWIDDMSLVSGLLPFCDSPQVQQKFLAIRALRKEKLSRYLADHQGVEIPPHFLFDIHIKRIHEYKRQAMNALRIICLYQLLKDNPDLEMAPVAFLFGGKAAMSYKQAKLTIELITALERTINNDPDVNKKLRVCFVEDYNVSKAMLLIPAADVSEQISTASKEASGTGNMKFQMSGALTMGTMDGANVEICEAVGEESMFVFGLPSQQVIDYEKNGGYDPLALYRTNPMIRRAVDALTDGTFLRLNPPKGESDRFDDLKQEWLYGMHGNAPDRYFVLKDLESYLDAFWRMNRLYREQPQLWATHSLKNIACSGNFSSDRMLRDYAEQVWKL